MESEIASSGHQTSSIPLGDRFDDAIGVTSSDIGTLLSELVRQSLRAGVSDLGQSLVEFAEEQVEAAIVQQMPSVAEAADGVAQSTAKRVVQKAVAEFSEQSETRHQIIESKILDAEARAVERSRSHVDEVVSEVRQRVDETRSLAVEGKDSSERKIQELREKARQSWCKVLDQFTAIHSAHQELRTEHDQLREAHEQVREDFARVHDRLRAQTEVADQKCSFLQQQNQLLEERLAALEKPRGLRALLARFQSGTKAPAQAEIEDASHSDADEPG